jgi:hypothetical protein
MKMKISCFTLQSEKYFHHRIVLVCCWRVSVTRLKTVTSVSLSEFSGIVSLPVYVDVMDIYKIRFAGIVSNIFSQRFL